LAQLCLGLTKLRLQKAPSVQQQPSSQHRSDIGGMLQPKADSSDTLSRLEAAGFNSRSTTSSINGLPRAAGVDLLDSDDDASWCGDHGSEDGEGSSRNPTDEVHEDMPGPKAAGSSGAHDAGDGNAASGVPRTFYQGIRGLTSSLFVLDFDDTLFPTSWLTQHRETMQASTNRSRILWLQLQAHSLAVNHFFRTICLLGDVVLVTLADVAWVRQSMKVYLPRSAWLLREAPLASARCEANMTGVSGDDIPAAKCWQKSLAMRRMIGHQPIQNLISIGDSQVEQIAARYVGGQCRNEGTVKYTKTVKLAPHPDLTTLTLQLCSLAPRLPSIVREKKDMHFDFTVSPNTFNFSPST